MILRYIAEWWRDLPYARLRGDDFRLWGVRLYGKRWFLFAIDDTDTAVKKDPQP